MKGVNAILTAAALVLALSLPSWAQGGQTAHTHRCNFLGHRGDHRS